MQWEQWTIYGSSLSKALLVNRKFPEKQFEASFEEVLFTTQGALNLYFRVLNDQLKERTQHFSSAYTAVASWESNSTSRNGIVLGDGSVIEVPNSRQLLGIIDQAISTVLQEVDSAHRKQESQRMEKQAMEYESMLNTAYRRAQELEAKMMQFQEWRSIDKKEAEVKISLLVDELHNARLVNERAMADQSKLKLVEKECKRLEEELKSSRSCLYEMELSSKALTAEVDKLTSHCESMGNKAGTLKNLFDDAKAEHKAAEEWLLKKVMALEEEIEVTAKREEKLRELVMDLESELGITKSTAAGLESRLNIAPTREEIEAEIVANMLQMRSVEMSPLTQNCQKLVAAVMGLSNKIARIEDICRSFQIESKSKIERLSITVSTLELELSCNREVIRNLQTLLNKKEDANELAMSHILSLTGTFDHLNEQLKHEITRLQMQIAPLIQENEFLNAALQNIQRRIHDSLHARHHEELIKEDGS